MLVVARVLLLGVPEAKLVKEHDAAAVLVNGPELGLGLGRAQRQAHKHQPSLKLCQVNATVLICAYARRYGKMENGSAVRN